MEFLTKATASVFTGIFHEKLLDRSSVVFVTQNINQRI